MPRRSFEERMGQPGEAQTRYYLAELGWVRPEDAEGGTPAGPEATAEAPWPALAGRAGAQPA